MNIRHTFLLALGLVAGLVLPGAGQSTVVLVPAGAAWRYLDNGTDQGDLWRQPAFIDTAWPNGAAQLGYGDGDETTVINGGPSNSRYVTTYFRRTFVVPANPSLSNLTVHLVRDDGGIVYLNGVEIFRSNMPVGPVNYLTFASSVTGGGAESQYFSNTVSAAALLIGTNVLAVEIHQSDATSSDVSFNLALTAVTNTARAPAMALQPTNTAVEIGGTATFSALATGSGPLGYQWRRNGQPLAAGGRILGTTGPLLTLTNLMAGDGGGYSVVISNSAGAVTSLVATLTVLPPPTTVIDDFEPGIDLGQWAAFSGTARATNFGGSVSPRNALTFGGDPDRIATTRAIDTTAGGFVSFSIRLADGSGEPWETADLPDEAVVFEYSTDRGSNWVRLATFDDQRYYQWTLHEMFLPSGAIAPRTQFRWRQLLHSGSCCDHWAIDDVYIESVPFPPLVIREPEDQIALEDGTVRFSVEAAGTPDLTYLWTFNGTALPHATNATLDVHGVTTNEAGLYRVFIENSLGTAASREARLTVIDNGPDVFRITALTTNQARAVGHGLLSGSERGGLALSTNRLLVPGASATACFDLADLSNGTATAVLHDALLADLRTRKVYALGTDAGPLSRNGGLATRLLEVEDATGALTGGIVPLSKPISLNGFFPVYGNIGFFSGFGRAAVHDGTNVNLILLPSGTVLDLGPLPVPPHIASSTWAYWGVLELFDGAIWLAYAQDATRVVRTRVQDGWTQTLATFGNLGNMASFTVLPSSNRWYFRSLFSSDLASGFQNAGYADASFSFTQETQAVTIVSQPRSRSAVAGSTVEFAVSALGYPLRYQWHRNGSPLGGETGPRLRLSQVTSNDSAIYTVNVGNGLGTVTSSGATLRVVAPLTVPVFDDDNFVATYGGPYAESDSVQASLGRLGHQVLPFATSNLTSIMVQGRPVLFPPLNYQNPARVHTAAQRQAVRDFVLNGGRLLVHGSGYSLPYLNDLFGLSLVGTYIGTAGFPRTSDAEGSEYAAAPPSLPVNSSTYALLRTSVPQGARQLWSTNNFTVLASMPIGSGRIVYLGWDWSDAVPLGRQDGGWLEALGAALLDDTPLPPGPPAIAVQPSDRPGVVGLDVPLQVVAYGPGPISYQWYFNGTAIPGARASGYTIALPTTNHSGGYFVTVSNLAGTVTSRVAQVSIQPPRGQAGYFTDYDADSNGPELSILQAGFTPVKLTDLAPANLAPLRLLVLTEAAFNNISPALQARLGDLTTWVQSGGRLVVHEINSGGSLLIGTRGAAATVGVVSTLTVVPPGDTLVTSGPHGTIVDTDLVSSNFLAYGALNNDLLPLGARPILGANPTQAVAFAYGLGSGVVYYSTILLAYYLDTAERETELLQRKYLPNVIEFVHAHVPSGPAVLVQGPADTAALRGGRVNLQAFAAGAAPLAYRWHFNGAMLSGATNATLVISNANESHVGSYHVIVSNPLGSTSSPPAQLTLLEASVFKIQTLAASPSQIVDHDALTGDDRGGIAVSSNQVFISGDNATARYTAASLGSGTSLNRILEGLIGNLRDESVYVLASGTNQIFGNGGTVDGLLAIDGNTGAVTTNRLALSRSITLPSSSVGIFSGYDAALIHDGSRAWRIDFHSGFVTDLGFMPPPVHQGCETWAYWGVAEFHSGALWMVAVRDGRTIERTRVPDGLTETVASFTSLSDMCSFTFSPSRDRWYFHYEGSAQFGGTSETLGYAPGTWDRPPTVSILSDQTINEDATTLTLPFTVADDLTERSRLILGVSVSDTNVFPAGAATLLGGPLAPSLSLTPAPDRFGTSVVTVTVMDAIGGIGSRVFQCVVLPVNDPPTFTPGTDPVVNEDAGTVTLPAWISALTAGPNEAGQVVSFLLLSNSAPALFAQAPSVNAAGELTFTTAPNAYGTAQLVLAARDDGGTARGGNDTSVSRSFSITILPVNDAPVATPQSVATPEDTALPLVLSGMDVEGSVLTFRLLTPPAHGVVTGTPPQVVYMPASNFHGTDTFSFVANDGQADSAPGTVSVTVSPVNDPPVPAPLTVETDEDTPVSLVLAAADPEGEPLTFSVVTSPARGQLSGTAPNLTYTPATNLHGADQFSYSVHDGQGGWATGTVQIVVRPVNDAPVATNATLVLDEDGSGSILLGGTDPESDPLTFTVGTPPAHGTLTGTPPQLTYRPAADFNGRDSFTFIARDGGTASAPAVIEVIVLPVNDAPVATPQTVGTDQDVPVTIRLAVSDVDGDPLKIVILASPAHGTLMSKGLNQIYVPAAGFHGTDSFRYEVRDGQGGAAEAVVSIVVRQVNDPPIAVARVLNLIQVRPAPARGVVLAPDNLTGAVILDASLSSDPDGTPLTYSWRLASATDPFARGVTVTNRFPVGRHRVTLLADDGQAASSATVEFDVVTAASALADVIAWINTSGLPSNRVRPLVSSLEAAAASFGRGQMDAGANQLGAFQHKVRAQLQPTDPAMAGELDATITGLLQALGF